MPLACYRHAVANLQIKNVPEDVHAELRRRADACGMTQRDYVLELIRRDQQLPTWAQWRASRRVRSPIDMGMSGAEAVADARREREEQLARRR